MAQTDLRRDVAPTADEDAEQALIDRWIYVPPYQPAEPRLKRYHVEVWAVIGVAQNANDMTEVAATYDLPMEAVEAALAYYRRHPLQIDAHLEANAALLSD